jgi:hypothetical protein
MGGAREVEEVSTLGVVELERPGTSVPSAAKPVTGVSRRAKKSVVARSVLTKVCTALPHAVRPVLRLGRDHQDHGLGDTERALELGVQRLA